MKKFAQCCSVTDTGMNEGWCWGDGDFYTSTKEMTINELKGDYPDKASELTDDELLSWAEGEGFIYFKHFEIDTDGYFLENGQWIETATE